MEFFHTAPPMKGYRGDTFPEFLVRVDLESTDGYSMRLVLENQAVPGSVAMVKQCYAFSDAGGFGWYVVLDSDDTNTLAPGAYTLHFIMTDPDEKEHRNLVGTLTILGVPQEVS